MKKDKILYNKIRKIWTINPKERIIPNKKKDQSKKIAEQEIKEIGNA